MPLAEAILGGTLKETKIIWNFEIRFLVIHLNLINTSGSKSLFTLSVQTRIFPPKFLIKFKCMTRKLYNLQEGKKIKILDWEIFHDVLKQGEEWGHV